MILSKEELILIKDIGDIIKKDNSELSFDDKSSITNLIKERHRLTTICHLPKSKEEF